MFFSDFPINYLITLPISNKETLLTYLSYCTSKGAVKAVILAFFAALVFVTRNIGSDALKFGRTGCKDKWGYLQSTGNDDHKTGREVKKLLRPSKLPDISQNVVKMLSGAHNFRLHSVSTMAHITPLDLTRLNLKNTPLQWGLSRIRHPECKQLCKSSLWRWPPPGYASLV